MTAHESNPIANNPDLFYSFYPRLKDIVSLFMIDEWHTSKIHIPRLRVSSYTQNDASYSSLHNVSQRTVSSSTSILSTPSNNIRRVQQMNDKGRPRDFNKKHLRSREASIMGVSSTSAASRKLLNLHQSRKTQLNISRPFVLRKPASLAKFDYSVFVASYQDAESCSSVFPPPIKDSQIRAWESAEKICNDIIFDAEDQSPHDEMDIFDETADEESADSSTYPGEDSIGKHTDDSVLISIPQYTKGEFKIILRNFENLRSCASAPDPHALEDLNKKELWLYRQRQNVTEERAFTANHSFLGKRKVQVFHKKEFLHKLFGYTNNINKECVTNNTSYSSCDNSFNVQKAFHEDKEEIMGLLAEDKCFEEELRATKESFMSSITDTGFAVSANAQNSCFDQTMGNLELLDLTNSWLTSSYERQSGIQDDRFIMNDETDHHPEMLAYTLGLLKQRAREAYGDPLDTP